jgi:hypothetical protein
MEMRDDEHDSMCFWYPKIKNLDIPQPKTVIVNPEQMPYGYLEGKEFHDWLVKVKPELDKAIQEVGGYPVFIRTDAASGKHDWKDTCYIPNESKLEGNIFHLIEWHACADILGLPWKALVVRQYIPMKNLFTAFHGDMPVNPEIRMFVRDGKAVCWHWYWIEDALYHTSIENWKEIMDNEKEKLKSSLIQESLRRYAEQVGQVLTGEWSVDFCLGADNKWWLIDIATFNDSWHPSDCPNCPESIKNPRSIV